MKHVLQTTTRAIQHSLRGTRYKLLFAGVALAMFFLYAYIPVLLIPGNDLAFQFSLLGLQDYALLAFLSLLNSLFITMQVYAVRKTRSVVSSIGKGIGGSAGALFAGIAGTAFCVSCLAPLFALFGIGFSGVIFTLQYRFYFVGVIVIFMLVALYLTSKKISKVCNSC